MKMKGGISIVAMVLFLCVSMAVAEASGSSLDGFSFVDRDIGEILYAASMYRGIPIAGDDTVYGKASFRFAGKDFDSAFDSFLKAERLYVEKYDDKWSVSRIHIEKRGALFLLDVSDVKPAVVAEKVSAYFGEEITFDTLPETPLTLHTSGTTAFDFISAVVRQLGKEFSVDEKNGKIHVARTISAAPRIESSFGVIQVEQFTGEEADAPLYHVDVRDSAIGLVLEKLFSCAGKQFVLAGDGSVQIRRALFSGKKFEDTLDLLSSQGALDWSEQNGVYYLVSSEKGRNKLFSIGKVWNTYSLSYKTASSVTALIQNRFGTVENIVLPGDRQFLCFATAEVQKEVAAFVSAVDVAQDKYEITLLYIHTADLLAHLPPEITASQIVQSIEDNVFFFTGTEKQYDSLCKALKTIDCPVKQIRYDLLVMQYQRSNDASWNASLTAKRLSFGDLNNVGATLGSVLTFNLDVLSAFGLKFASSLQCAINENKAHVFADTTLHGVNGGTISFKNTNTYRYRDNNIDPDTGKPVYSGVTREIISGLKLDVTGWVSGDGMITSKVTASVSRQGTDLSSKTGNPPPTSEKIITTEVRGRSGEPVVLSGLVQDESSLVEERSPLISKVPALGWLFKSHKKTEEKTEMVIYLVPRWEKENAESKSNLMTQNEINERNGELFERLLHTYILNKEEKNEPDTK